MNYGADIFHSKSIDSKVYCPYKILYIYTYSQPSFITLVAKQAYQGSGHKREETAPASGLEMNLER